MYVKLNWENVYLWCPVEPEGEVLKSYVTRIRDKAATFTFMKKALKLHGSPEAIITDELRSYRVAMDALGRRKKREVGRWANNRVENSHLPFRRRERAMLSFRQPLQKFSSVRTNVHITQPQTLPRPSHHLRGAPLRSMASHREIAPDLLAQSTSCDNRLVSD